MHTQRYGCVVGAVQLCLCTVVVRRQLNIVLMTAQVMLTATTISTPVVPRPLAATSGSLTCSTPACVRVAYWQNISEPHSCQLLLQSSSYSSHTAFAHRRITTPNSKPAPGWKQTRPELAPEHPQNTKEWVNKTTKVSAVAELGQVKTQTVTYIHTAHTGSRT